MGTDYFTDILQYPYERYNINIWWTANYIKLNHKKKSFSPLRTEWVFPLVYDKQILQNPALLRD